MNELVTLFDGNPVTNTLILAEGTGNQHASVINLVRKYADDLSEFGLIAFQTRLGGDNSAFEMANSRFEIANSRSKQGRPTEFAYLNEPQATLLMTYMSNTPIIREFKKRLVAAFFELAAGRALSIQNTPQNPVQTKVSVNTSDLVREANKGNRFAQRLLHHLTGMQVDDIAAEIEYRLVVEDFKRAELAANYLDLLLADEPLMMKLGISFILNEEPGPAIWSVQATTTQYFNAFGYLGKKHGLPMLAKSVEAFGTILSKEAAGLEFYGWRRSLAKIASGKRLFRFEQIVNA